MCVRAFRPPPLQVPACKSQTIEFSPWHYCIWNVGQVHSRIFFLTTKNIKKSNKLATFSKNFTVLQNRGGKVRHLFSEKGCCKPARTGRRGGWKFWLNGGTWPKFKLAARHRQRKWIPLLQQALDKRLLRGTDGGRDRFSKVRQVHTISLNRFGTGLGCRAHWLRACCGCPLGWGIYRSHERFGENDRKVLGQ